VRMGPRLTPLPATLPAVFTSAEARAAGIGPHRLGGPDLRHLARGLYARTDRPVDAAQIAAAVQRDHPDVVVWGTSAAELLEIPLPRRLEVTPQDPVHLASSRARRDTEFVTWHRISEGTLSVAHAGVRVTSRIQTLLDLRGILSVDELTAAADHLVRIPRPWCEGRRDPYATIAELRASAAAVAGHGAPGLRAAIEQARVGSDSPAETALRLGLLRAGLPTPALNAPIFEARVALGEPDLSWPEYRVCLENEGPSHLTREQLEKDIRRGETRERHGWKEVRTTATDLRHGAARAVDRVSGALRGRGWRG
jgi:hypothetical protein